MKSSLIYITVIAVLSFTSCGGSEAPSVADQKKSPATTEVSADMISLRIDSIRALDQALMNSSFDGAKATAKRLYQSANRFATDYPDNKKTADVLELSAKACDVMGKYEEAVNILHTLINDFPETEETPKYMFQKGMLLGEKMHKIPNAKAAFSDLSVRFPESQWSTDATSYVNLYLGKSQEETQQVLDSLIQANQNI
jgi:TolA-binding protein